MKTKTDKKTLVVLTGPTAVGKTATSLTLAQALNTEIISADARQFYRELTIGTAAPTQQERTAVEHHFAGHLSIFDYYNVSLFEKQALALLADLFTRKDFVLVSGGSGLYLDALCHGIDDLPDIPFEVRSIVKRMYQEKGIAYLRQVLKYADPDYFEQVDTANPNRMMRGIEIYLATGKKFSALRKKQSVQRPFQIKKIILNRPRQELFQRINERTKQMVDNGVIEEALRFYPQRNLNALNTVGYKELFAWLGNRISLHHAIEDIKTNTRRYAKRQLTWFKKYEEAKWFLPSETGSILRFIRETVK